VRIVGLSERVVQGTVVFIERDASQPVTRGRVNVALWTADRPEQQFLCGDNVNATGRFDCRRAPGNRGRYRSRIPFSRFRSSLKRVGGQRARTACSGQELTEAHAQVTEALDQQTATSEILKVISASPTDVQPVFDAILESAVRLCGATVAGVYRFDGDRLEQVAAYNATPAARAVAEELFGRTPSRDTVAGMTVLDRRVVHIEELEAMNRDLRICQTITARI
jgi:hypothetical protein